MRCCISQRTQQRAHGMQRIRQHFPIASQDSHRWPNYPLYLSVCPLLQGLYTEVQLTEIPNLWRKSRNSREVNDAALSEWIQEHIPKSEKRWVKHWITVLLSIFAQGKAKGNLENSSITIRRYLFLEEEGSEPLKSKDRRSNSCVTFIKGTPWGLWSTHDMLLSFSERLQQNKASF